MRFQCPYWEADLVESLLASRHQTYHGIGLYAQWETPNPNPNPNPAGEPQMYWVSFPSVIGPCECPVNGVPGKVRNVNGGMHSLCAPPHVGHIDHRGGG